MRRARRRSSAIRAPIAVAIENPVALLPPFRRAVELPEVSALRIAAASESGRGSFLPFELGEHDVARQDAAREVDRIELVAIDDGATFEALSTERRNAPKRRDELPNLDGF